MAAPNHALTANQSFYTFGYIDQDTVSATGASEPNYADVDSSQGFWQIQSTSATINGETIDRSGNTSIMDTGTTLCLVDDSLVDAVYKAIPGRYVNRIGNATYTLDGVTYNTQKNDGPNTLHVGTNNWSYRFWNVTAVTDKSITFSIHDPSNSSLGMIGDVDATVTYTVSKNKWSIVIDATSPDQKTPLMLTQHTYFQLDAFKNPTNRTIWNHTLYAPEAKRALKADQNALPTGEIAKIPKNDIDDFWSKPHQLGFASGNSGFENHCGNGCHGYNGALAFNDKRDKKDVALTLSSEFSGIKAELTTNQDAVVLYTCNWNDGKTEFKSTQGVKGQDKFIPRDGCIAIEAQDYVDGINQ